MKLIDADALKEKYTRNFDYENCIYDGATVVGNVDEAPTVDAVPVIRCKDCKNYKTPLEGVDDYCTFFGWLGLEPDGFCAWAERKKE